VLCFRVKVRALTKSCRPLRVPSQVWVALKLGVTWVCRDQMPFITFAICCSPTQSTPVYMLTPRHEVASSTTVCFTHHHALYALRHALCSG
jgi:hypothetical protein